MTLLGADHAEPYPDRMDDTATGQGDATADLLSQLEVIEAQPLASRASAYESLHDALARRLEADPSAARP